MLDLAQLSINDHVEFEAIRGHPLTELDDLGNIERMQALATAWWLQHRRENPDYTLEEALNAPLGSFLPVEGKLDPTILSGV